MDLTGADLHPLYLKRVLDKHIPGWLEVEPPGLWDAVLKVGPYSHPTKNKIQAIRTAILSPQALEDWRVFEKVVLALNGIAPNFLQVEPPAYSELIAGAEMLKELIPDFEKWGEEVLRYSASVAMFRNAPELLPPLEEGNEFMYSRGNNVALLGEAAAFKQWLRSEGVRDG